MEADTNARAHCPSTTPLLLPFTSQSISAATDTFRSLLDTHKWIAMPSIASRARQASAGEEATASGAAAGGEEGSAHRMGPPPYVLMEHFPLAVYTNGLLAAFNELRHCTLLSLQEPAAAAVQVQLWSCT